MTHLMHDQRCDTSFYRLATGTDGFSFCACPVHVTPYVITPNFIVGNLLHANEYIYSVQKFFEWEFAMLMSNQM